MGVRLFSQGASDRMRRNGFKLCHEKSRLNAGENVLIERVARHWNLLPRAVME